MFFESNILELFNRSCPLTNSKSEEFFPIYIQFFLHCHKRCQALLNFYSFQLSYNSRKGGAREREYKITNGNLYIHEAKTDGSYDESWIATDEEVHRFLSKYLWKLSLNDVII